MVAAHTLLFARLGVLFVASYSLGFFDDIAEGDWCRKKQHSYDFPNIGTVRSGAPNAWYGNNFEPTFTCPLEERQGLSDGPKWLCDPYRLSRSSRQKHHCLVYSVGSANEFSFEESIYRDIGSHCEIHTFDPSVGDNPSNKPPYVHYHNWGISGSTGGVMKTLADTVKLLGHAEQHIELFKMDCEGCEWATYSGWFTSMKFKPRQMMIELHGGTDGATPVPAEQLLNLMRANHYVIYHKETNAMAGGRNVGQKLPYVKYHSWDISDTTAGERKTLADTVKLLGHESVRIEIFKLDCDGCEFTVYNGLFTGLQYKPRQFLVDLHDGTTGAAPVPAQRFLMHMRANHYVAFHKEQAVQVSVKKLRVSRRLRKQRPLTIYVNALRGKLGTASTAAPGGCFIPQQQL
eukprot:g5318.t1